MMAKTVADWFSGPQGQERAYQYLKDEGLIDLLQTEDPQRIAPDYRDLARLHQALRARRVFTVLEFGIGYSTLVMADALIKNKHEWTNITPKPRTRNHTPFEVHSVDASANWIEKSMAMLPEQFLSVVRTYHINVSAGIFQDRACHFYDRLPDVVPDFIYLDGPDPADVQGDVNGLTWRNPDRCVMSGDILRMEPSLLPGTLILVDGRTANSLFLSKHLYRKWDIQYSHLSDVTVMELQDRLLGDINRDTCLYCLGERALHW